MPDADTARGNGAMSGFVCNAPATDTADRPEGWHSDKWATPWPVLTDLERRFGAFDLDPCCEPHTAKAPMFYTVEDDGLSKPWFGNVYVNPPYSNPRAWCERALQATQSGEADTVVMLLPCATDTAWFHEIVWPHAELHFVRGRVRFLGWRGTPLPSPRAPSLVAVFRTKSGGQVDA
jgi:phage N-6-adenine-methyltransferase